ncbi:hypothetical protein DPEC_G00351950 [Dallia pectoralis]|uniref:Uncharacterized protein n=1 Tax=Dallia pectoralis TaxID=75939 RepID=A0ACC2F244_DALPE|nr:hypothetical protein DPEC_G00351950 [Dallia pectoralis]
MTPRKIPDAPRQPEEVSLQPIFPSEADMASCPMTGHTSGSPAPSHSLSHSLLGGLISNIWMGDVVFQRANQQTDRDRIDLALSVGRENDKRSGTAGSEPDASERFKPDSSARRKALCRDETEHM